MREIYTSDDPSLALDWVLELADTCTDGGYGPEIRAGRTLRRWADAIAAWHASRATNGPTEPLNNLAKRIKRVAFRMTNFRHWRIRVLLYAGRPDWSKLPTITPSHT